MSNRRVILAGGSGFLGRSIAGHLANGGYEVVVLSRSAPLAAEKAQSGQPQVEWVRWDARTVGDWAKHLEGAAAVVNLAGKNVNCRYTAKNLAEIDRSRVDAVHVVGKAIAGCKVPPTVLIQAATLAIYGDAGERTCDENCPPGEGIPPQTTVRWESAFNATPTPGTRRVLLRISFVLGRDGGVLPYLAGLTRWFLGGAVGTGKQHISWIHIDDLCRVVQWAIEQPDVQGAYNATSPHAVTNAEFMRKLRRVLHRPWVPRTPAWFVHIGSFFLRTEPVLALTGRRGIPTRLLDEGFQFKHTDLHETLSKLLGNGVP